jgi:molybdate transport system substrate-binding protein
MFFDRRSFLMGLLWPSGPEIVVSAAVSLKDAMQRLSPAFYAETGATARFNFGASGILQKQIEAGAPADVFISAGQRQMDELEAKGLIAAGTRRDIARNSVVLVVPSAPGATVRRFADLSSAGVRRIATGNPKTVPAGQYARQVLDHFGILKALSGRIVFGEDVRQVLDYVVRGEVDAGIVYATDAAIAGGRVTVADRAPESSHDPVLYPAAVVRDTRQPELARKFLELVAGPQGRRVLSEAGFLPPTVR